MMNLRWTMAETYKGIVKEGVVVLSEGVQLTDGLEAAVVVLPAGGESVEDVAWAALSAEAWAQDWVEEDSELIGDVSDGLPAR
jgi:hypothetical protein